MSGSMPFGAHGDNVNQQFSIIGVVGTLGTADAGGTAKTLPIGVDPATGAQYVFNLGPAGSTSVAPNLPVIAGTPGNAGTPLVVRLTDGTSFYNAGASTVGTFNNIATGTQQTLGTVGTILGIGGTVAVSGAGGGVQYGEGSTVGTATGNALLFRELGGTLEAVGTQFPLPVEVLVGTAHLNQSGGNLIVNVSNFALGQFGANDALANNLTSALTFSEGLIYNGTTFDRTRSGTSAVGGLGTGVLGALVLGTDSGGTIRAPLVNAAGAMSVSGASAGTNVNIVTGTQQTLGTVGTVPGVGVVTTLTSLSGGTISNILGGTITALQNGTISFGTAYKGVTAPAAGSLVAAGTITVSGSQSDTIAWDIGGTWVGTAFFEGQIGTSAFFAIPAVTSAGLVGTLTTGNGDYYTSAAGLDTARLRVTYSSGTLTHNERSSPFFAPLNYNLGGTIGNVGMLNGGTINAGTITAGSIVVTVGTVSAGTINAGTITAGSIVVTGGTVSAGTINTGTINAGTINVGTITAGTINTGTVNTGTINTGTVNTGTINAGTINIGTFQINPIPATKTITSAGTTTAGTIGTLIAAPGAGTAIYVTGFHVLTNSGTVETVLSFGLQASGNQVVARGLFPAGGGITEQKTFPNTYGATGTALTWNILSTAGTIDLHVDYFTN